MVGGFSRLQKLERRLMLVQPDCVDRDFALCVSISALFYAELPLTWLMVSLTAIFTLF